MQTKKLYYEDPFLREFTAVVLSCEPLKTGYSVVLDRTAFYPEGGGQPADHGTINGVAVTDVHEKSDEVIHICENSVEVGEPVTGKIDWTRRFDHMQQHSGEHILSGILCKEYHCDNVGFHMGAETVTIDYNTEITWEQAMLAEQKANAFVAADLPVQIEYPSRSELDALDYRSKKELTGQVRIVTFPGADCCACCGTHVLRTGQVGLVKILSLQKFRDGIRMEIVSGNRALRLFSAVYDQNRLVAQQLSVKPDATAAAVERLKAELAEVKERMSHTESALFALRAEQYADAGDVLLIEPSLGGDEARRLADAVARRCGGLAAVFAGENGRYNYALLRSDGTDIAPLVKALNAALHGRGGGRNGFAQGSVQAEESAIREFFAR